MGGGNAPSLIVTHKFLKLYHYNVLEHYVFYNLTGLKAKESEYESGFRAMAGK